MFQYAGKCPNCFSDKATVLGNIIDCGCGVKGDLGMMRFCNKVPVFSPVKKEDVYAVKTQVYADKFDGAWVLEGYAPGCGRPVSGDYCISCRGFLPIPSEKPKRKGKRSAREEDGGET